ncbi:MAG: homoserine O-acetyltransferase [Acidimicrobiales bacterium]|nr:homoserine O-acetyltransferase [Acidimicrobiales bacterium]
MDEPPLGTVLPVSGAWRPGDPPGRRRFLTLATDRPLALEGGGVLGPITLAYETWGTLDATAGNAVLVCHALTGDAHAAGAAGTGHPGPGWWDGLIGPGRALDTDRWFVVCVNVLGGCQGTTGPASIDASTGRPFGPRFPVVSVRDMVRTQRVLADHLGVQQWLTVIGGSMGGMQVLEWGVTFPTRVRSLIPVATTAQATAQQIALGAVGRNAIRLDPAWRGGDYYAAEPGDGPHRGLAIARMLAQITYRSDDVLTDRFGREMADLLDGFALWQRFEVERYLEYHGEKLVRRFDANSYLVVSKAMDLHDVGRGRGGFEAAMARVRVPTLALGIRSDELYPPYQQRAIRDVLAAQGVWSRYVEVDSPHGHDAFLIELDQVGSAVSAFLDAVEKGDPR